VCVLRVCGWRGEAAHTPLPPSGGFLVVAGIHEGEERERRIAQPAEPVVPVADPADPLRQRGGGRSGDGHARWRADSAPGMSISQRLQCDQRARPDVGEWAIVLVLRSPAAPELFGYV